MYDNNATQEEITQDFNITTKNEPLISLSIEGLRVVQLVNPVVLSGTVCLFGIVANTINMVIFVKQGMTDNINLSLFAISFSDLCSLITLEWLNMNLNPFMEDADIPFEPVEIQYFTGGWPHSCFARITIWITIYVTTERFCCISFPLKFKETLTLLRSNVVICIIYSAMFCSLALEYPNMYFRNKYVPARNQTRVGLIDRSIKDRMENTVFLLYAVIGVVSLLILIFFTALLVTNLKQRSNWKTMSTLNQDQSNATSSRDKKTMKIVSLVAIIVIICFTPAIILYVTVFMVPGFNLTGIDSNIFHASWSIAFLAEAINSSVNIFLFYKMSTKYKRNLHALFSRCRLHQTGNIFQKTTVLEIPESSSASNSSANFSHTNQRCVQSL